MIHGNTLIISFHFTHCVNNICIVINEIKNSQCNIKNHIKRDGFMLLKRKIGDKKMKRPQRKLQEFSVWLYSLRLPFFSD